MANEKRLIDANALQLKPEPVDNIMNGVLFLRGRCVGKTVAMVSEALKCMIDNAPTVDAVEVPPVKIGDTAYFIIRKTIYEAKICLINWCQYRYTTETEIRGEVQRCCTVSARFSDWGVNVFSTKEEAEIALAKMDGGKDNG